MDGSPRGFFSVHIYMFNNAIKQFPGQYFRQLLLGRMMQLCKVDVDGTGVWRGGVASGVASGVVDQLAQVIKHHRQMGVDKSVLFITMMLLFQAMV